MLERQDESLALTLRRAARGSLPEVDVSRFSSVALGDMVHASYSEDFDFNQYLAEEARLEEHSRVSRSKSCPTETAAAGSYISDAAPAAADGPVSLPADITCISVGGEPEPGRLYPILETGDASSAGEVSVEDHSSLGAFSGDRSSVGASSGDDVSVEIEGEETPLPEEGDVGMEAGGGMMRALLRESSPEELYAYDNEAYDQL